LFLESPLHVALIGAPIKEGQKKDGVQFGPKAIRESGIVTRLEEAGCQVEDTGDISYEKTEDPPTKNGSLNAQTCGRASKALYEHSYKQVASGKFSLVLGGDHSLCVGSISAVLKKRPDTVVVYVDAHCDINTGATSPSGNIHGMPVALLMKLMKDKPGFEWTDDVPKLPPSRIVYIGLRDVDHGEKNILRKLGVKTYSMHDIDRYNIGPIMDMALKDVDPYGERPIHLSFDIDAVDPQLAPSTGVPVIGGLTFREAAFICETLAETGRLCSMDMVEVNPLLEPERAGQTADLAKRFIACAVGEELIWGTQPHMRPTHGTTPAASNPPTGL